MGDLEILIDEEGTLKVAQQHDMRFLVRLLPPKGFERHRVDRWPRYSQDSTLTGVLVPCFLFTLIVAVIMIFIELSWTNSLPPCYWVDWREVVLLAAISALLVIAHVKMNMTKTAGPAEQRKEEVKTVSGSLQQVKHQGDVEAVETGPLGV